MAQAVNDLSRSLVALEQDSTLICVIELSASSWLLAASAAGLGRSALKKLKADEYDVLRQLHRWRDECAKAGHAVGRIVVAFESGRDGFWLARWLMAHGIEVHVMHAASVTVSREHRRAKTDRLDTQLLMRALLGWLRGEIGHCRMCAIPTLAEEDARRPGREREALMADKTRQLNRAKSILALHGVRSFNPGLIKAPTKLAALRTPLGEPLPEHAVAELERLLARLALVRAQLGALEDTRAQRLERSPSAQARVMIALLSRVFGLGEQTAEMLCVEVFLRPLRDHRAVSRFVGLTGSPDESGARRRQKGLSRSGSARARHALIQMAWRFVRFQSECGLVKWFAQRTAGGSPKVRKTMIVALARKLAIALWRMATTGQIPEGLRLHPQPQPQGAA